MRISISRKEIQEHFNKSPGHFNKKKSEKYGKISKKKKIRDIASELRRKQKGLLFWRPSEEGFQQGGKWSTLENAPDESSKIRTEKCPFDLTKWKSHVAFDE